MIRLLAWAPPLFLVVLAAGLGVGSVRADPAAVLVGTVVCEGEAPIGGAGVFVRRGDDLVAETRTDAEGRFRVELDEAGAVDVHVGRTVRDEGADGKPRWLTYTAEARSVDPTQEPVRLVAKEDPEEGQVRLRMRSPEGNVESVFAQALPRTAPRAAQRWWPMRRTDAIGRVDLDGLPLVPVDVRVERRKPWCPAVVLGAMPDPEGIDLYRVALARERLVEGRVIDGRGDPVAGWGVMARGPGEGSARAWGDLTGLDGRFQIGVPETWSSATLLVGCDAPDEASPRRRALEIQTTAEAVAEPLEIVVEVPVAADEPAADEAESLRVMETVLRAHYVDPRQVVMVLVDQLDLEELGDEVPLSRYLDDGVQASTEADLRRKAEDPGLLPAGLDAGLPLLVLGGGWIGYLHRLHDFRMWRRFYDRFPDSGGYVALSPVGFSEDGTQAVIHVSHIRWRLNADGHYHLLEKRDGAWVIVKRAMTWVS